MAPKRFPMPTMKVIGESNSTIISLILLLDMCNLFVAMSNGFNRLHQLPMLKLVRADRLLGAAVSCIFFALSAEIVDF